MRTSPLFVLVCALIGLAGITFSRICTAIAPRRVTHADLRDVFHQQLTIYQQEMDKVKQGYAVWPPNASKDEVLKALNDYLCGRPVQWYKQQAYQN